MARRQALRLNAGGTIVWEVPEEGAITSATVSVYDETGAATAVAGSAATVTGRRLSVSVSSGIADAVGLYRAEWSYSVAGVAVVPHEQKFWVVRNVARSLLSAPRLPSTYWPAVQRLIPRQGQAGAMGAAEAIAAAWEWLEDEVGMRMSAEHALPNGWDSAAGIHLIVDAGAVLERAQAHRAAYILAANASAGDGTTEQWQAWAEQRQADADAEVSRVLASRPWADTGDTLQPGSEVPYAGRSRVVL